MYDLSDPRARLAPAAAAAAAAKPPAPTAYAGADYARFYDGPPQETGEGFESWIARGQNFLVVQSTVQAGARLARRDQADEYAVLLPDPGRGATVTWNGTSLDSQGHALLFVPPGSSEVVAAANGRVIRIFSTASADLNALASNAASYAEPHPNVASLRPWPEPRDGWRVRGYELDVGASEGRFGRIFRCTTLMVNVLDPREGLRDVSKLSPHHHDDFEQGSLVLDGGYIHDIRWPWTPDMRIWRKDEHEFLAAPSLTVIPPPSIHTSRSVLPGLNQMIDIFSPPRLDFSKKPGWVINADDYPMPEEHAR